MGQYFRIVNLSKKHFIDIDSLGENNKFDFLGQGLNGIVLARLLCSPGNDLMYGDKEKDDIYIGLWAGDSIVIAGDYDMVEYDSENGKVNLYDKVILDHEYTDITTKVIAWLMMDDFTFEMLRSRAVHDKELYSKIINSQNKK
jgi:hypothetical protein